MTVRPDSLARKGFRNADQAAENLRSIGAQGEHLIDRLIDQLGTAASPDDALAALAAIAESWGTQNLHEVLGHDQVLGDRLIAVLGVSEALGFFLARHPEAIGDLGADTMPTRARTRDEYDHILSRAGDADELRVAYRRCLLCIAARDLAAGAPFADVAAELADLAMATLQAALTLARAQDEQFDQCRLAIIALGKTGGRELNYVSDVDVVFVHEAAEGVEDDQALRAATRLAGATMRMCSDHTAEGTIWEVDPALRPEGHNGPLVRTVDSHIAYYQRWATTWEFQALMKARYAAGDAQLAGKYLETITPMVWEASTRENFVADTRSMRRRVLDNIPTEHRGRQLKLGAGGLRDVEFAVQLLQLVHGRADVLLRSPTTTEALEALIDGGYVGRRDGASMEHAYEFLRTLEHRIQLHHLRRTHMVPDDPEDLRRIGRSLGMRRNPADELNRAWQMHRREVRRLHEKLFYRPLLQTVAEIPTEGLRLTSDAAQQRLYALGFADPSGALNHIQALTRGVSRRAAIQESLLPAMLSWFAESPNPDAGLLAFRSISEELGDSHWYLRKLRDEGEGAQQLAHILASSRYTAGLIKRAPDSVAMLGDDDALQPRSAARLHREMHLAAARHPHAESAIRAIRRVRRRELARVAIADALGRTDVLEVGEALTDIATATLSAALAACIGVVEAERGELTSRMAIVLMGRLGGHELGYSSDADVMFVYDPNPEVDPKRAANDAFAVAQRLRTALAAPGQDPPLHVDADLRPEGRNGPLVRTLASYRSYYAKWSQTWEAQALLRADPAVGDPQLRAEFAELIDPLRWPDEGLSDDDVVEIRRIKARVDAERLPRGANPNTHLKLGRGGIADIEWTIQLIQMRYAHCYPALRTTHTLQALQAAVDVELIGSEDAHVLSEAWRFVSRVRNAIMLMRAKPAESMVEEAGERAGVAHLMGYELDEAEIMVDDYLRMTRHAHQVVERIFWQD